MTYPPSLTDFRLSIGVIKAFYAPNNDLVLRRSLRSVGTAHPVAITAAILRPEQELSQSDYACLAPRAACKVHNVWFGPLIVIHSNSSCSEPIRVCRSKCTNLSLLLRCAAKYTAFFILHSVYCWIPHITERSDLSVFIWLSRFALKEHALLTLHPWQRTAQWQLPHDIKIMNRYDVCARSLSWRVSPHEQRIPTSLSFEWGGKPLKLPLESTCEG